MFSLQSRPRPLAQGLAADVLFDGRVAAAEASRIAAAAPDRRAGQRRATARTAARVARALESSGFPVEPTARSAHAGERLVNVIGRRAGRSRRQIVVVADRDAAGGAGRGRQRRRHRRADRAGARARGARRRARRSCSRRSTARTLGEVGATRLLRELPDPDLVDGVLVMSDLASPTRRGPFVQAWSNDDAARRASACSAPSPSRSGGSSTPRPGSTGSLGQLARLSFPIGIGAQGVLLERRLRRRADRGQRRAAARRQRAGRVDRRGHASARSAARRCARSRRSTAARGPSTGRTAT